MKKIVIANLNVKKYAPHCVVTVALILIVAYYNSHKATLDPGEPIQKVDRPIVQTKTKHVLDSKIPPQELESLHELALINSIDPVLKPSELITSLIDSHSISNKEISSNFIKASSVDIPIFETLTEKEKEEVLSATSYGEMMTILKQREMESDGVVPHSQEKGNYIPPVVKLKEDRFLDLIRKKYPLTPEQILILKQMGDLQEVALNAQPNIKLRSRRINYNTAKKIPKVYVAKDHIADLVIVDMYGNDFPITKITPADTNHFTVTYDEGNNVAGVVSKKISGSGNISIKLEGKSLPLSFQILTSRKVNDASIVVQVNDKGPNSEHVVMQDSTKEQSICKSDQTIENIVDGVISKYVSKVDTNIDSIQLYRSANSLYMRSRYRVASPDCECIVYGAERLNVCRLDSRVSHILYMDASDKFQTLKIKQG